MKRILAFLLAAVMLTGVPVALAEARYEGKGASTPRELALAYVQALNDGDVDALIRLFAIESAVDNKKPELYPDGYAANVYRNQWLLPVTNNTTRSLLIAGRYTAIAVEWFSNWLYWCNPQQYETRIIRGLSAKDKMAENPEDFLADMKSAAANSLPGNISALYIADDVNELVLQLEPNANVQGIDAQFNGSYYNGLKKMWGCDDAVCQGMILQLGQETVFTAPVMVRYGAQWYLMEFGSPYTRLWDTEHPFHTVQWNAGAPIQTAGLPHNDTMIDFEGFDSPQKAILTFAKAWQQGDVEKMIRCFAVEPMVNHFDTEAYLNTRTSTSIYNDPVRAVPVTGKLSYGTLVAERRSSLNRRILYGYLEECEIDNLMYIINPEMFSGLQQHWSNCTILPPKAMSIGDPVTEDCALLRSLLGDSNTDRLFDHEGKLYVKGFAAFNNPQVLGCEAMQQIFLPLTLNGEDCLLSAVCAQYSGRWYLYEPGGFLIEIVRGDGINRQLGLLHLSQIDKE